MSVLLKEKQIVLLFIECMSRSADNDAGKGSSIIHGSLHVSYGYSVHTWQRQTSSG